MKRFVMTICNTLYFTSIFRCRGSSQSWHSFLLIVVVSWTGFGFYLLFLGFWHDHSKHHLQRPENEVIETNHPLNDIYILIQFLAMELWDKLVLIKIKLFFFFKFAEMAYFKSNLFLPFEKLNIPITKQHSI